VLNFIYYPVSFIMWVWHQAFGYVLGEDKGITWALSVVFLVFTLRLILYKPFVGQVRSMRKMQEMAPEMQKLRKKYANDKQKLAAEMQKLQSENGANPLAGCLPVLVQVPVFIGLFHVLREFRPGKTENYFFGADEVKSFIDADLFGAKLGASVVPLQGAPSLESLGTDVPSMLIVMIPLMIAAGIFTHITARHSVARQAEAQAAAPQAAIMNKLMLYVFPIGVVVGAPFLPLAILFYWVSNNLWTLGQQYLVYRKIDAEETEKREQAVANRNALAPKPGQKPQVRPQGDDGSETPVDAEPSANGNGSTNGNGSSAPAKKPGAKPVSAKRQGGQGNRSGGGGSRSQAARNKGRKRR
jgi:YidC/Oxa1 family membrane protein insertase